MKAALAIILFACIAGSMASPLGQFSGIFDQLLQQGQTVATGLLATLQQQLLAVFQQGLGSLQTLIGGRFDIDFAGLLNNFSGLLKPLINQVLSQVLGALAPMIGGRASLDLGSIFSDFWQQIQGSASGILQHVMNQGAAAVLGSLGSLTGSRGFDAIWGSITSSLSGLVSNTQTALQSVLTNLQAVGQGIIESSKPHLQQLQEQLVGHGLNVLGSISETVNNLHGSITGGR